MEKERQLEFAFTAERYEDDISYKVCYCPQHRGTKNSVSFDKYAIPRSLTFISASLHNDGLILDVGDTWLDSMSESYVDLRVHPSQVASIGDQTVTVNLNQYSKLGVLFTGELKLGKEPDVRYVVPCVERPIGGVHVVNQLVRYGLYGKMKMSVDRIEITTLVRNMSKARRVVILHAAHQHLLGQGTLFNGGPPDAISAGAAVAEPGQVVMLFASITPLAFELARQSRPVAADIENLAIYPFVSIYGKQRNRVMELADPTVS